MKGFCKNYGELPIGVYYFRTVPGTIYYSDSPISICQMADQFNQDYYKITTIFHKSKQWIYREQQGKKVWSNDSLLLDFDNNFFIGESKRA